jgi:uncharacterized membrane protein
MVNYRIRQLTPFVFAIAVVLTAMIGSGKAVGVVAAVGGIIVGAIFTMVKVPAGIGRDRNRNRDRTGGV